MSYGVIVVVALESDDVGVDELPPHMVLVSNVPAECLVCRDLAACMGSVVQQVCGTKALSEDPLFIFPLST